MGELLRGFQKSSSDLLTKLSVVTTRHEQDAMMPMLTILKEHVNALSSDIGVFAHDILPEAPLPRSQAMQLRGSMAQLRDPPAGAGSGISPIPRPAQSTNG